MTTSSWLDLPEVGEVANRRSIRFEERPTCTVREACYAVGLGKTKMHELIGGGAIESISIGRRRLVRVPSLLNYLNTLNAPTVLPSKPENTKRKPRRSGD